MPSMPSRKDVKVGGRIFTVYSIGWLSLLTHRKAHTIRGWQRHGLLPAPVVKIADGSRWYTAAELIGYSKIFLSANVRRGVKIESTNLKDRAHNFARLLKVQLRDNPDKLPDKLPNFELYEKAVIVNRLKDMQQKAQNILSQV